MLSHLDTKVLVLNRLWQAVNVCSVRRAFSLLCQGHAHVVDAQEGEAQRAIFATHDFTSWLDFSQREPEPEMIHGVTIKLRIPRIIVLLFFDRLPRREVKFTRLSIFERDKNTCQYCGQGFASRDLNLDHVLPKARGGLTNWENIVCSCIPCNTRKGNRLPDEVGMSLIRKPKRPRWRPCINLSVGVKDSQHHSWLHFIDLAYWNVELGD